MYPELQELIEMVKTKTDKSVEEVINYYFSDEYTVWSMLKDEWTKMSKRQRQKFITKISKERAK